MRRTRSVCCVWAESGQTTAAPPRIVMNSRRRIASPEAKDKALYRLRLAHSEGTNRCPLWVKSRHMQCTNACPLYPQKQTCAVQLGMALGQKRTLVPIRSAHRRGDIAPNFRDGLGNLVCNLWPMCSHFRELSF